uniref:Myotubularin-related protein 9 n=1 Tax=Catagonus wagneri TaxID=51154 RepID=A0A8C3YMT9_9CETA
MEFAELIKTPRVDNVVLHRPFYPAVEGTLCLTGHHLILSSRQDNTEELWLLHSNIDAIDKRFVGPLGTIIIKCKDFRIIQLDIPGMEECLNIASSIEPWKYFLKLPCQKDETARWQGMFRFSVPPSGQVYLMSPGI